ncbi:hypothetical protein PFLmoz3_05663 [Pseudomonas fluorescens]|uniref:Uncharacterized protein n=1 Tax=Pseudomonas fluorescens TaxID=294 RepID=A0A125QHI6_PSEFL|nr:hypothetical protein PFLmoz3_05663 [Pseudomonas fluorescens]
MRCQEGAVYRAFHFFVGYMVFCMGSTILSE